MAETPPNISRIATEVSGNMLQLHGLIADVRELQRQMAEIRGETAPGSQTDFAAIAKKVSKAGGFIRKTASGRELSRKNSRPLKQSVSGTVQESAAAAPALALAHMMKPGMAAGMTHEQQNEFKKLQLVVSQISGRVKDTETKLETSFKMIHDSDQRINGLLESEEKIERDLYAAMNAINSSLSEKVARQRIEMQKLANDTPQPINYDPFNYGEAYAGNIVDFEARKRITEMKCLMDSLTQALTAVKNSITVSHNVDLGYRVVRMDELLESSGFHRTVQEEKPPIKVMPPSAVNTPNPASAVPSLPTLTTSLEQPKNQDQDFLNTPTKSRKGTSKAAGAGAASIAMVVTPNTLREAGKVHLPKPEMFVAADMSTWSATDSIMQTMYRLEMEIAELQKIVKNEDIGNIDKNMEEIKVKLNYLKDTKMDATTCNSLLEKMGTSTYRGGSKRRSDPHDKLFSSDSSSTVEMVNKNQFQQVVTYLNYTVDTLSKRIKTLETKEHHLPHASGVKTHSSRSDKSCMSCDRPVDSPAAEQGQRAAGNNLPYLASVQPKTEASPKVRQRMGPRRVVGRVAPNEWAPPVPVRVNTQPQKYVAEDQMAAFSQDRADLVYPKLMPLAPNINIPIKGTDGKLYAADPSFDQWRWLDDMNKKKQMIRQNLLDRELQNQERMNKLISGYVYGPPGKYIDPSLDPCIPQAKHSGTETPGRRRQSLPSVTNEMTPITNKKDFDVIVNHIENLIVVLFSADWCAPCHSIRHDVDDLMTKYDNVAFYKIDVDQNDETAEYCGVKHLPTFIFYVEGNRVATVVGADTKAVEANIQQQQMSTISRSTSRPFINIGSCSPPPHSPPPMDFEVKYETDKKVHEIEEKNAAIAIQAGMRGMMARKSVAKAKEEKKRESIKQEKAATKIQAGARGMMARKHTAYPNHPTTIEEQKSSSKGKTDTDTDGASVDEFKTNVAAATKIQAGYRGMVTRRSLGQGAQAVPKQPKIDDAKEEQMRANAEAATKIQAGVRGMLTRKTLVTQPKQEKEKEKIDAVSKQQAEAATKIQAGMRGMLTRKELHKSDKPQPTQPTQPTQSKQPAQPTQAESLPDVNDPDVQKATLMIQKRAFGGKNKDKLTPSGKSSKAPTPIASPSPSQSKLVRKSSSVSKK